MFTDTHCHLAASPLREKLPETIAAAKNLGVSRYIVPATQPSDWQAVLELAHHPDIAAVAIGVHPWFANQDNDFIEQLANLLRQYPRIWIGEIGLDKFTEVPFEHQQFIFEQQLILSQSFHRPVIIHNVRASAAILATLKKCQWQGCGIIHAFSGSLEEAKLLIQFGFKIGLGSLLLNPNAKKVRALAAQLPISAIVLETDSPFMLPNQVNMPANIHHIAEIVAQLRGMDLADLAAHTNENVDSLLCSV